jgi:hypothetical protein
MASQQASGMPTVGRSLLLYETMRGKLYDSCMQGKGYQQVKSDEEREIVESSKTPSSSGIQHQGDRWMFIASSGKTGENYWFIDTQTISRLSKDVVRVWIKATVDEEGRLLFQHAIESSENLRYVFILVDVNCQKCAQKTLKLIFYGKDDVLIDSSTFPLDEPWQPIDPGSMFMIMFREICP